MQKAVIFIILLLLVKTGYSQHKGSSGSSTLKKLAQDTIVWRSDSLLTMENFKGKPKGNPLGLTTSGILFYADIYNPSVFHVEAIFIKSKSFLRENAPYVLKHEQLHFDITELYARKLRRTIVQTDFKKVKNIGPQINRLYEKAADGANKEQEKYDRDTENGANSAKQQVWNDTIAVQLKGLDEYSSPEINIVK